MGWECADAARYPERRKVARADEWGGLESRCGLRVTMGSNPIPSAMLCRLATTLVALAILASGCGGNPDEAVGTLTTTPTPSTTPVPENAEDPPEPEPTPAPDDADDPPELEPTPAPEDMGDPSDAYFALERVLDISIEIDPEHWDTLRHQTRTPEDVQDEIKKFGFSQPFSNIYSWFPATVTVDGETHTEVGVRKKGFVGSQSSTKPSLKLRYDKYVDDQALGGVMERMAVNNSIQDASMVNTCLSYRVFAAAGSPAPRCNFATVSVNGEQLGLYVHVEEIKAPFLRRHFESSEGNLYEGTVSDFTKTFRGTIEKKNNEKDADWSDIDAVVAAMEDQSEAGFEALAQIVDMDRFLSFWATEVLVGHWDGYTGHRVNYHFYREPDGLFVFIPWGPDQTFPLSDDPNPYDNVADPPPSVMALTIIPRRLYGHPEWRAAYVSRLKELLDTVWNEEDLLAEVDEMAAIVQQHALPEQARAAAADTLRVREFILERRDEILADLTPVPPDSPWQ